MELLGTYSITRVDEKKYALLFEIPDNCIYSNAEVNGVFKITVKLKPGEKQPTTTFKTENISCTTNSGLIDIIFIQEEFLALAATYITRPKIRIDINE